jgi:hypothetical protein
MNSCKTQKYESFQNTDHEYPRQFAERRFFQEGLCLASNALTHTKGESFSQKQKDMADLPDELSSQ